MCYSKEVSLAVGSVIAAGCGYSWWRAAGMAAAKGTKAIPARLLKAFEYGVIGLLCIGGHQLFEFWAIYTMNPWVYKIGLIISLSCTYFIMRSLETLVNLRFGSQFVAALIALTGVYLFTREMTFENLHFWVRGHSHAVWAGMWMALFIYWNVCLLYARHVSTVAINRRLLLWYAFLALDFSFLVAVVYAYLATFLQKGEWACPESALAAFELIQDSPSVWCVFAGIHAFFLLILFKMLAKGFDFRVKLKRVSGKTAVFLVGMSVAIWLALFFMLPLVWGVGLKMVAH